MVCDRDSTSQASSASSEPSRLRSQLERLPVGRLAGGPVPGVLAGLGLAENVQRLGFESSLSASATQVERRASRSERIFETSGQR